MQAIRAPPGTAQLSSEGGWAGVARRWGKQGCRVSCMEAGVGGVRRMVPAALTTGTTRQADLTTAAYAIPVAATVASGCGAASPFAAPDSAARASCVNKERLRSTPQR